MAQYDFDTVLNTRSFQVAIDSIAKYGYFEHKNLGDECGGGLWFDNDFKLVDYDGVAILPKEIKEILIKLGHIDAQTADDY